MAGILAYTAEYALTGSREGSTPYIALNSNSRAGGVNPALFRYPYFNCYGNCIHYIGPRIRLPAGTTIEEFCAKQCFRPWPIPDSWWWM